MSSKRKKPEAGRPTEYTPELGERICTALIDGRTLTSICEKESWAPHRTTVYRWRKAFPDFNTEYLEARRAQMELRSDEAVDIADNAKAEEIPQARLKLEARRVQLSRLGAIYVVDTGDDDRGGLDTSLAERLERARKRAEAHDAERASAEEARIRAQVIEELRASGQLREI